MALKCTPKHGHRGGLQRQRRHPHLLQLKLAARIRFQHKQRPSLGRVITADTALETAAGGKESARRVGLAVAAATQRVLRPTHHREQRTLLTPDHLRAARCQSRDTLRLKRPIQDHQRFSSLGGPASGDPRRGSFRDHERLERLTMTDRASKPARIDRIHEPPRGAQCLNTVPGEGLHAFGTQMAKCRQATRHPEQPTSGCGRKSPRRTAALKQRGRSAKPYAQAHFPEWMPKGRLAREVQQQGGHRDTPAFEDQRCSGATDRQWKN